MVNFRFFHDHKVSPSEWVVGSLEEFQRIPYIAERLAAGDRLSFGGFDPLRVWAFSSDGSYGEALGKVSEPVDWDFPPLKGCRKETADG